MNILSNKNTYQVITEPVEGKRSLEMFVDVSRIDVLGQTITLTARLYGARSILSFCNGSKVEVVYIECGDPEDSNNWRTILEVLDCKCKKLTIPDMVVANPGDVAPIDVEAEIYGSMFFYLNTIDKLSGMNLAE